jgi:hypothetical protein
MRQAVDLGTGTRRAVGQTQQLAHGLRREAEPECALGEDRAVDVVGAIEQQVAGDPAWLAYEPQAFVGANGFRIDARLSGQHFDGDRRKRGHGSLDPCSPFVSRTGKTSSHYMAFALAGNPCRR